MSEKQACICLPLPEPVNEYCPVHGDPSEIEPECRSCEALRVQARTDAAMIEELRQLVAHKRVVSLIGFMSDNAVQCWPDRDGKTGVVKRWTASSAKPFVQISRATLSAALIELRNELIARGALQTSREELARDANA
jgi:hypothetical protein